MGQLSVSGRQRRLGDLWDWRLAGKLARVFPDYCKHRERELRTEMEKHTPSDALLAKLEALIKDGEIVIFSKDEAAKLRLLANAPEGSVLDSDEVDEVRDMLTIMRGLEGLGVVMNYLRKLLFWGGMIVVWTLWLKGKLNIGDLLGFFK